MLEKEKDEENNSIKKNFFLSLIRVKSDICTFSN